MAEDTAEKDESNQNRQRASTGARANNHNKSKQGSVQELGNHIYIFRARNQGEGICDHQGAVQPNDEKQSGKYERIFEDRIG